MIPTEVREQAHEIYDRRGEVWITYRDGKWRATPLIANDTVSERTKIWRLFARNARPVDEFLDHIETDVGGDDG